METYNNIQEIRGVPIYMILDEYNALLSKYNVRTRNVLSRLRGEVSTDIEFFRLLFSLSEFDLYHLRLRQCGHQTAAYIKEILQKLHEKFDSRFTDGVIVSCDEAGNYHIAGTCEQELESSKQIPQEKLQAIDETAPIVLVKINSYPARVRNAFLQLYKECHNSLVELYGCITNLSFNIRTLQNLGKGSFTAFKECLDICTQHVEMVSSMDLDQLDWVLKNMYLRNLGVNDELLPFIKSFYDSNGYFPLFAILDSILESLPEDLLGIIKKIIPIYSGQEIASREEAVAYFYCTYERIRQKRNKLLEDFPKIFASLSSLSDMSKCPYKYQMNNADIEVNSRERTNFNLNFVNYVLGSVYDDVSIEGDVYETLANKKYGAYFIVAVPSVLLKFFDFHGYIDNLRRLIEIQREDEERIELRRLIEKHVEEQCDEAYWTEIEISCESIICSFFNLKVEYGTIYFPANTYKTIPKILEDIIRDAGRPLNINELVEVYADLYPDRNVDSIKVAANARRNEKIVPISREGIYTLAEWRSGTQRGGTIRSYVDEFLDTLPEPIASFDDIYEYIRQYRPNLTTNSLNANLMSHAGRRYNVYVKGKQRFIGLADHEYSEDYVPISPKTSHKRTFEESIELYDKFVLDHGFIPRHSGESVTEEEKRLARFLNVQNSRIDKGLLSKKDTLLIEEMKARYANLNTSRIDTFWLKWFHQTYAAIRESEPLSDKLQTWLSQNIQRYYSCLLIEWQMDKMRELLHLMGGSRLQ